MDDHDCTESMMEIFRRLLPDIPSDIDLRAAVAPELNRPIIEKVADRILEELNHDQNPR
jgi:hypothetical protein